MNAEWYCRIMGDEWGPMSAMELIAVARWGRLSRDDLVRRGDSGTWVRAELVKGLFNSPPVAATVTSDRLVAVAKDAKKALPAKRSVRRGAPSQYWMKIGEKVSGPFSSSELRHMAEQGALKASYLLSRDRRRWTTAGKVKGLSFGGAKAIAATMSVRSAVWLNGPYSSPQTATADFGGDANAHVLIEAGR